MLTFRLTYFNVILLLILYVLRITGSPTRSLIDLSRLTANLEIYSVTPRPLSSFNQWIKPGKLFSKPKAITAIPTSLLKTTTTTTTKPTWSHEFSSSNNPKPSFSFQESRRLPTLSSEHDKQPHLLGSDSTLPGKIEYGFTDKDYPYIVVKDAKVNNDSPDYGSDYDEPSTESKNQSDGSSKKRKVLRCKDSDGKVFTGRECREKMSQRLRSASPDPIEYLNKPIYRSDESPSDRSNNDDKSSKNKKRGYQDDYDAKEEEKWAKEIREWDKDEPPYSTSTPSSSTKKSKPKFGARSEPFKYEDKDSELGIKYSSDDRDKDDKEDKTDDDDNDKYYTAPEYSGKDYSEPEKSKSKSPYPRPTPSKHDDPSEHYKSKSTDDDSSDHDSSDRDDSDDGYYGSEDLTTTSRPAAHDEPKKERSYEYSGRDQHFGPKLNLNFEDGVRYYTPTQGYDDYAINSRRESSTDDETRNKMRSHDNKPIATYDESYKPKSSENRDNDDHKSSYSDSDNRKQSPSDAEFDSVFKEHFSSKDYNYPEQESRRIGNIAKDTGSHGKDSSMTNNGTTKGQIVRKNGGHSVLSASMLVD